MTGKRGYTLVELMVTIVASSAVIGATASLYGFVVLRTADAVTQYNAINGVQDFYGQLANQVSDAVDVNLVTISGVTMLKLTMPQSGTDRDNDGLVDFWNIQTVNKMMNEVWGTGTRVWYYTSDASGDPGRGGTFVFRATRTDDANITTSDVDRKWSFVNTTTPRLKVPGTITFANDIPNRTTTVTSTIIGNERGENAGLSGTRGSTTQGMTLKKRFYWRGFTPG